MRLSLFSRYKKESIRYLATLSALVYKPIPILKKFSQTSKLITSVVFSGIVILLFTRSSQGSAEIERQKATQSQAVAVTTVAVAKQNVPIELDIIGNVYPYESVSIKARIDSQITKVNFKPGDVVEENAILFQLDDRSLQAQLSQLEANFASAEAQHNNAQIKLGRDGKLVGKGFSSRQQYDDSKTAHDSAIATLAADRAAIDDIKVQIDYATIRSPLTGRAGTINITQGNTVKSNDTLALVTINQVTPIWVQMSVPQRYYEAIRQALSKGEVNVVAKRDNGQDLTTGTLKYINNTIDTTTGTFTVRARFENLDESLWPGMFVNTVVELGTEQNALVIPLDAVQNSQTGTFVFAITADNKAIKKPITLLRSVKQLAVINSDLKEGDHIIVDNIVRLTEGSKVTVTPKETSK